MTALSCGSTFSMRAIAASTNSPGDTSPVRTSSACAVASIHARSSFIAGAYERRETSAAGQAEQAFADDRALHLAGAAGDRRRLRPQPLPLPLPRQRRVRALQLQPGVGQTVRHVGPD